MEDYETYFEAEEHYKKLKLETDPYFNKVNLYFRDNLIHGNWVYDTYIDYLRLNQLNVKHKTFERFLHEWYGTSFNYVGEYHLYRSFIALYCKTENSPPNEVLDFKVYKDKLESLSDQEYIELDNARTYKEIEDFWERKKEKKDKKNNKHSIIFALVVVVFIIFFLSNIDIGSTLIFTIVLIIGAIIFGVLVNKAQND